jgi:hypothetical protein
MWLARYFPGLHLRFEDLDRLLPETTTAMRKAGDEILKTEAEERFAHTKIIAGAAGIRLR